MPDLRLIRSGAEFAFEEVRWFQMKKYPESHPPTTVDGVVFEPFRLEADGTLWRNGQVVHLAPKELSALRLLLTHAGRIVTPLQLKHALWDDVHVSADSVPKCMSSLRARLLPDDCIQTVYKRGYRLTTKIKPLGNAAGTAPLPRLAVLPFDTGYTVAEHLGTAIAEETIAHLGQLSHPVAQLVARDSVFALAAEQKTARQVGEMLKADYVLTGTLRAMTHSYRLRAELVRVADNVQVWVEDLLVPQNRIDGVQAELVERLALRMESGSMLPGPVNHFPLKRSPHQREAYEFYLRGHQEWQSMQRHRMQDGLQKLLRSIELDPDLMAARTDLAHVASAMACYGFLAPTVAAEYIRHAAANVDDDSPEIEALLPSIGWMHYHLDRNADAAAEAFQRSEHLPHDLWTSHLRVMYALSQGRFEAAIEHLTGCLEMDPYSPWLRSRLGWALHLAGEKKASVHQIEEAVRLFPGYDGTCFYGSIILAYNGMGQKAVDLASHLTQRLNSFDLGTAAHAYTLACAGQADEARMMIERLQWLSRERFVLTAFTAAVHVRLGETQAALGELQTADQQRCPWFFQTLADPRLADLQGEAEFAKLMAQRLS